VLQALTLERIVRRFPEQYFWLHRRWKHQPAARKRKRAA
jgi:KDO2-lipid IV(A) lauroyltransferase